MRQRVSFMFLTTVSLMRVSRRISWISWKKSGVMRRWGAGAAAAAAAAAVAQKAFLVIFPEWLGLFVYKCYTSVHCRNCRPRPPTHKNKKMWTTGRSGARSVPCGGTTAVLFNYTWYCCTGILYLFLFFYFSFFPSHLLSSRYSRPPSQ